MGKSLFSALMLAVLAVFVTYLMIYHTGKQTKTISFSASDYPER